MNRNSIAHVPFLARYTANVVNVEDGFVILHINGIIILRVDQTYKIRSVSALQSI